MGILNRRRAAPTAPAAAGPPEPVWDFPRPLGAGARQAGEPWRLPDEPAISGIAADAVRVGALTVRAASLVGPAHRCAEPAQHRQDAYRLGRDQARRHLLVAVADGMSDSSRSHLGANVAVTALIGRLRADLARGAALDAPALFLDAARQMSGMAAQQQVTENDVRAAALAAVVPVEPAADGRRLVWAAWLADVGAWVRADTGWRRLIGDDKRGLDGDVLTEFLPFHPDRVRTAQLTLERGAVLALATDGIGDGFADGAAPWFAGRWADPPHIASFVADVGYDARGLLDDRTAVVIWCDR
ncbi:protein phosphatase 2C domain-containing protein [Actinomadura syzygii]|uniref:protein phosphatase 2C domain-containing protein n=1 Tax=Actinomadura syzygii TaxID=1427538 RepID=UPI00165277BB|nr:protein phosphatase 2C domain-containing protein [Actinomadura syzygii]